MSHNSDMIRMLRLVEGQQFAGLPEQQPGDQVRGTEQAKKNGQQHPFHNRLVGEEISLEDKLSKKYQDMKDLHSKEEKEKDELEKKVVEGSLNELSVSTLSSYGKKAEKSNDKKLNKAAGHSEKATNLYSKGTSSAVAKSFDHEDKANKLHNQVNKRDANMDRAAGKLKNKMSKGMMEGNKQLDELFEPTLNYYTLSNGKKVQVSYRPNTNQSPVPFTDVTVSYVDPALKPMGPSFDSTGVAQPWTSAPDGVKQAIQKFATQSSQGVAEAKNKGQYEMMMRNGQVKKFIAKDDADARRIAAGHGAKSVIRMKGNVPGDKIGEQGVAEASDQSNAISQEQLNQMYANAKPMMFIKNTPVALVPLAKINQIGTPQQVQQVQQALGSVDQTSYTDEYKNKGYVVFQWNGTALDLYVASPEVVSQKYVKFSGQLPQDEKSRGKIPSLVALSKLGIDPSKVPFFVKKVPTQMVLAKQLGLENKTIQTSWGEQTVSPGGFMVREENGHIYTVAPDAQGLPIGYLPAQQGVAEGWDKLTPQQKAHEYNLDAAQREMDRRHAQGEDMKGAEIDKKTYEIVKPKQQGVAEEITADDMAQSAHMQGLKHGREGSGNNMDRAKAQHGENFKHYNAGFLKGRNEKDKRLKVFGQGYNKKRPQPVAEGDRPFRGVDGAFDRGDDEQHDLDPTDWYIVKDGEMFLASIYPNDVQQAIAQGFSRTEAEAKAKAKSQANSQTGSSEELEESQQESPMERPMLHRIMMRHMDLIEKYGIDLVLDSVRDVADSMNIGPDDEIGTSDVSAAMVNVMNQLKSLDQTIDEENIPAGNINASGSPTVSSGPTPVSAGGTAPVTQSSTAPAPAASTAPAAAGQQPPMTPEELVALNKIKANAGLKTQYDRLIQQAH